MNTNITTKSIKRGMTQSHRNPAKKNKYKPM